MTIGPVGTAIAYESRADARGMAPMVRLLLIQAALVGIYFIAGLVGLRLAIVHPSATAIWPPTGIALAAMLLLGYRVWPAILLGAFLVNLATTGLHTAAACAGIAAGNTLEALAGAWLAQRFARGVRAFEQAGDVVRFAVLAGVAAPTISATIGVTSLALGQLASWDQSAWIWLTWWLGDASSALIIAPLIIVWGSGPRAALDRPKIIECAAMLGSVMLLGAILFVEWSPAARANRPIGYLALLPLLWAAFRCGTRGAATAAFLTSAVAIRGTLRGVGPFVQPDPNESLLLLQAFTATVTLTALILAAVVNESRRIRDELVRATDEAQAANSAKDRFIAVLSHELRTPLTPVLGALTVAQDDRSIPPHVQQELAMIRRNIEAEARLIDDLLDLNRIAHGKMQLHRQPIDAGDALRSALEICQRSAARAHFVTELRASHAHVSGDLGRLQQVFSNLLNNAVKFMPEGGTITVRSSNPSPRVVRFDIIDAGVGIAPDGLPRLFEPFHQIPNADSATRAGGLGLGLAISRSLIEGHGGTLRAHSDGIGRGCTFTVELPTISQSVMRRARPQPEPSQRTAPAAFPARAARILLVEDHDDSARVLARLLAQHGHDVQVAGSVAAATQIAEGRSFDLLVSDLDLPDGSGLTLMRELKHRFGLCGIALTGLGMERDVQQSREAGFAEHLVKPVALSQLAESIARVLDQHDAALAENGAAARGENRD